VHTRRRDPVDVVPPTSVDPGGRDAEQPHQLGRGQELRAFCGMGPRREAGAAAPLVRAKSPSRSKGPLGPGVAPCPPRPLLEDAQTSRARPGATGRVSAAVGELGAYPGLAGERLALTNGRPLRADQCARSRLGSFHAPSFGNRHLDANDKRHRRPGVFSRSRRAAYPGQLATSGRSTQLERVQLEELCERVAGCEARVAHLDFEGTATRDDVYDLSVSDRRSAEAGDYPGFIRACSSASMSMMSCGRPASRFMAIRSS
jgi:hypothetical protein